MNPSLFLEFLIRVSTNFSVTILKHYDERNFCIQITICSWSFICDMHEYVQETYVVAGNLHIYVQYCLGVICDKFSYIWLLTSNLRIAFRWGRHGAEVGLGRLMCHMATVELSGMAAWLMGLERCHPLENVILQSEYTNMWGKTFNDEFSRMNLFDKYTYIEIVAIFQHALQMIRMKSWWMWNGWANLIRNSQLNFTLFDFNVKFRLFEFRNVV